MSVLAEPEKQHQDVFHHFLGCKLQHSTIRPQRMSSQNLSEGSLTPLQPTPLYMSFLQDLILSLALAVGSLV